jgi:hypothetical protein
LYVAIGFLSFFFLGISLPPYSQSHFMYNNPQQAHPIFLPLNNNQIGLY